MLSARSFPVLHALAMTIRVDMVDLECLHGSVRHLLMNMSKHTQDVDSTLAASMWISERVSEAEKNRKTIAEASSGVREFTCD